MNVKPKSNLLYLGLLLPALVLASCGPSRQLAPEKSKTAQLSRQLGFTVHRKDDIPLLEEVSRWLGTPYRHGGTTRAGADCSGFVGAVYKNAYDKPLQRTVASIYNKDCRDIGKRRLKPGDLVFFNFSKRKKRTLDHVGIYLKNGYFAHASTSRGVIVSHLSEDYYKKGWRKAGRAR